MDGPFSDQKESKMSASVGKADQMKVFLQLSDIFQIVLSFLMLIFNFFLVSGVENFVNFAAKTGSERGPVAESITSATDSEAEAEAAVDKQSARFAVSSLASLSQMCLQKANSLEKEIEVFLSKRMKENKKLAKDIATWVDTAMQISEEKRNQKVLNVQFACDDVDGFSHLE